MGRSPSGKQEAGADKVLAHDATMLADLVAEVKAMPQTAPMAPLR